MVIGKIFLTIIENDCHLPKAGSKIMNVGSHLVGLPNTSLKTDLNGWETYGLEVPVSRENYNDTSYAE